jgi:hypothetical protein
VPEEFDLTIRERHPIYVKFHQLLDRGLSIDDAFLVLDNLFPKFKSDPTFRAWLRGVR